MPTLIRPAASIAIRPAAFEFSLIIN